MQTLNLNQFIARQTDPNAGYAGRFSSVIYTLPALDIKTGPWLAGGSLRRLFDGSDKESDFDLFFSSELQLQDYKAELLNRGGTIQYENDLNVTMNIAPPIVGDLFQMPIKPFKLQLIKIYFSSAEEVLEWFDFTLCQFLTDKETLMVGDYTLYDTASKRVRLNTLHHAVSSVRRMLKYGRQGYTVCDGTIQELLERVSKNPELIQAPVKYID